MINLQTISEFLNSLESRITLLEESNRLSQDQAKDVMLTTSQVCDRYHVSERTLQDYRTKNLIPFHQHGRKIIYSQVELDAWFMNKKGGLNG